LEGDASQRKRLLNPFISSPFSTVVPIDLPAFKKPKNKQKLIFTDIATDCKKTIPAIK
jgi:hypothetical protein